MINVLISITSYDKNKQKYVKQLIDTYSTFKKYNTTIVLSCNYDYKPFGSINIPATFTDWNHTFQNKEYLKENYKDYDLIVETDDDVQVTETNLDYYLKWKHLPVDLIPGFLVAEGDYLISMKQPHFPFLDGKLTIEGRQWIIPHSSHSNSFIVDKERYGIFLQTTDIKPHTIKSYSVQTTSRVEIYNTFKKVVLISGINDDSALVQHLSMKYSNQTLSFDKWKFLTKYHDFP
jgi:hypothetical protein